MKIFIVYYSMYGHIHRMAEAVREGAGEVDGADVQLYRVPETLPEEVLKKMGALEAQKGMAAIPVCKWKSWPRRTPLFSAHRRGSATCAVRCASFSMRPGNSGHKGLLSAKWGASLPAARPSTAAKNRPS